MLGTVPRHSIRYPLLSSTFSLSSARRFPTGLTHRAEGTPNSHILEQQAVRNSMLVHSISQLRGRPVVRTAEQRLTAQCVIIVGVHVIRTKLTDSLSSVVTRDSPLQCSSGEVNMTRVTFTFCPVRDRVTEPTKSSILTIRVRRSTTSLASS